MPGPEGRCGGGASCGHLHRGNSSGGSISERGKELGPGVGGHGMGDGVLSLLVQVVFVLAQNVPPVTLLTEKWGGWATRRVLFSE